MVRIMAMVVLGLVLWAQGARAQETGAGPTAEAALRDAMRANPERFAADMTDLIAGFGRDGGLTPAGIEDHIALTRAGARATALRRLIALDLDADGTVTRAELDVAQAAASAAARGRMARQFAAADADGDGRIDPDETRAEGQVAALQALGEDEAGLLRTLLTLDSNGDGALTPEEVGDAVARLDQAT